MYEKDLSKREFLRRALAGSAAIAANSSFLSLIPNVEAAAGKPIPPIAMTYYGNWPKIVEFFGKAAQDLRKLGLKTGVFWQALLTRTGGKMNVRWLVALMPAWLALSYCGNVLAQATAIDSAKNYPNRPIRLVVPAPPGGPVDTIARKMAHQLEIQLGQPIVVDNRGGANGIIGFNIVAKAPPDGYTLMSTSASFAINPAVYKSLPYDTANDFIPITNVINGLGFVLVAHPSIARSVKELIALAKEKPLSYSSAGIGNSNHLAAELFRLKAGVRLLHVPYKGGAPALNAVLGGEVNLLFSSAVIAAPHVQLGRLRALGFTGAVRFASLPDVPTISEGGLPGFFFDNGWHAWFAPAKTPAAIVNKIHTEIRKGIQEPKLKDYFIAGFYGLKADTPAEFQKQFRADMRRYADIVKAAKIEAQ